MRFSKLHGAGNDFLIFDGAAEPMLETRLAGLVARLCERRRGVGGDGVLLVVPAAPGEVRVVYWNADGSAAGFCANGSRCAARFVAVRWGLLEPLLHTGYAAIPASVVGARVSLRLPAASAVAGWVELPSASGVVRGFSVSVGVPHLIVPVDWPDFWTRPLAPLAPELRSHPRLGEGGANVSFMRVAPPGLEVRSWERGVEGETLSCGSGDVAAALVALAERSVVGPVAVRTASGRVLVVEPEGDPLHTAVRLTGPAEWVADGELSREMLEDGET